MKACGKDELQTYARDEIRQSGRLHGNDNSNALSKFYEKAAITSQIGKNAMCIIVCLKFWYATDEQGELRSVEYRITEDYRQIVE
jgi:hypothetical protein